MKTLTTLRSLRAGIVAGLLTAGQAGATTFSYSDFSDLSDFQLNGVTALINPGGVAGGATNSNGDQVLRLTNNLSQSGSAFLTNPITLSNSSSFSTAFSFQFTDQQNTGADGIVFTVQTVSNTAGGGGGGIGFAGLSPSIGVEFDNWFNGGVDINANHAGVDVNGNIASVISTNLDPIGQLDAGGIWHAWVDYDGSTDNLEVRASLSNSRPANALLAYTIDLEANFGGGSPQVFAGFTSGTGAAGADHDILNWEFRDSFNPVTGVPDGGSTGLIMLLGLLSLGLYGKRRS